MHAVLAGNVIDLLPDEIGVSSCIELSCGGSVGEFAADSCSYLALAAREGGFPLEKLDTDELLTRF